MFCSAKGVCSKKQEHQGRILVYVRNEWIVIRTSLFDNNSIDGNTKFFAKLPFKFFQFEVIGLGWFRLIRKTIHGHLELFLLPPPRSQSISLQAYSRRRLSQRTLLKLELFRTYAIAKERQQETRGTVEVGLKKILNLHFFLMLKKQLLM